MEEKAKRCIEWMNNVIEAHTDLENGKPFDEYSTEVIEDAKYILECIEKTITVNSTNRIVRKDD